MGAHILLVDDEQKLLSNVKVFLELNGYTIHTAFNGEEGLAALEKARPDIIISDVMMPQMDGFSMLKEIKANEDYRSIPVIMLTAKESLRDLYELEGAAEFLPKPFDLSALLELVKKIESNLSR